MWKALPFEVLFECHKLEEEFPAVHISSQAVSAWLWLLSCIWAQVALTPNLVGKLHLAMLLESSCVDAALEGEGQC